ncbi:PIN-like domain-containing protein [Brytella acorum]|uniref:VapC45 PIN like domain-containing protein n=1 Tax=Brytella acorum TaxID=2959299 RepID=A0AA35UJ80_9PROT|nr:hypothetical protein [Brytella acorum]MDF3625705.1 hypothetical protein [Brytella acorum]CAI9121334.1 hypothetical protein LMG32879_002181 [Brytella acorum]
MRFVFDENHPPILARVVAPLGELDGHNVTSVRDLGIAGMKDVELFGVLVDDTVRTVLLTTDKAMSRRQHEVAAIRDTGAIVVVGCKGWNQQGDVIERARHLVWWWPMMVQCAGNADRGSFLELPWSSKVAMLKRWRA